MDSLIQKLMVSKQIMDRHNDMDRGISPKSNRPSMSESYSRDEYEEKPVPASYNIPQEYLQSAPPTPKTPPMVTEDRIKNSKLPDAIKKLMMEHPIQQPQSYAPTLSDDVIERASRLMGTKKVTEQVVAQSSPSNTLNTSNTSDMKEMMKSVVKEVLKENGMLIESVERTNDNFKFQVGNHIFEGKLTKIKKLK